ncbi:hypothetical protein TCELL_1058 [Thermogladius calderae 1633]|uniref:Ribonuclease VapC n=1 Tax=Thermogladius calderae (strain DSM 22663 / VKM B-2946 / 1633) TaxID=1184251 RepID=I3TFE3_THEC1|nr:type II toxin-antitoxin system VapC family toxin [Thermogladius calderae]AFK51481.1 hypothetical protein TCELL_1058 [Thermogladius calderae 1633]
MRSGLLFDSSSLLYALKERRLDLLRRNYVQWLTFYEALNGVWKEVYLHRAIRAEKAAVLVEVLAEVLKYMEVLSPAGLEREIYERALALGVTVYDASYVVLAERYDLTLVTEDKRLRSRAQGIVEVKSLRELVG